MITIDGVETDDLDETKIVRIQGKSFTLPSKDKGLWGEDIEPITISVFTDGTKKDSHLTPLPREPVLGCSCFLHSMSVFLPSVGGFVE